MSSDSQKHNRHSIRLPEYDYTKRGAYFITICTWQRECIFGDVIEGKAKLSLRGQIAQREWMRMERRFRWADFSNYVIMPNHVHGIIVIHDKSDCYEGRKRTDPNISVDPSSPHVAPGSLGAIVRAYKASVTWRIHVLPDGDGLPVWQRNYFDHIIRDEIEFYQIREYIRTNPLKWREDQLHPEAPPNRFNRV